MKYKLYSLIVLFIALSVLLFQARASASEPLYVVFLMDSSGSMQHTDRNDIRKLASQAVVTLLSPQDNVAVIEFDSEARVLSDWKRASHRTDIFNSVNKVGNNGGFTDFRAGLEKSLQLFKNVPQGARKIVLLLSDGKLEPNPRDETYAPYNLSYLRRVIGKSRSERARIYESEFLEPLSLKARRLIESDILPSFKEMGIEIYTVGLSSAADKTFLDNLADETSREKTESHSFYENHAVDLIDAFTGLLHFWENKIVVYTDSGRITPQSYKSIPFDEFLRDVSFIVLTDSAADFSAKSHEGNEIGVQVKDTHPDLKILNVPHPLGHWDYGFTSGRGEFRLLVVGKSTINMEVAGLKDKYLYGDHLRALVRLTYDGGNALPLLSRQSTVSVVTGSGLPSGSNTYSRQNLVEGREGFSLDYALSHTGPMMLRFTLHAYDRQGRELLPRPSRQFKVDVLPRFYVEPSVIKFGNVGKGHKTEADVKVYSGLDRSVRVHVQGSVVEASRCPSEPSKQPQVAGSSFSVVPGQSIDKSIILSVPGKGCWGDFRGTIRFVTDRGDIYKVGFSAHVPSICEKVRIPVTVLLLLLLCMACYLIYVWGYLGMPQGVLMTREAPPGEYLISEYRLSEVRQGFFSRWFNWRRNKVLIRNRRPGIPLSLLSSGFQAELRFYRFGGTYIANKSSRGSEYSITINEQSGGSYQLLPGQSLKLSYGSSIGFEGYEFTYER